MYNELLRMVKNNKAMFHFYLFDLLIDSEIKMIEVNDNHCKFFINDGKITIWKDNKIEKCMCPDNLVIDCKYCFRLYNQYGERMGYIYIV